LLERINSGDGVNYIIQLDGAEVYKSPVLSSSSKPVDVQVPVSGGRELALIVDARSDMDCDWAIWGDPRLR